MSRPGAGAAQRAVPRRLAVLFLLALLGVLTALGVAVHALAGALGVAGYGLAVAGLLGAFGRSARRLVREREQSARASAARTCTCCTTSQHDPVRVV